MLYLRRKKGKSFTLFILIFLISTFITTSLALMYTTNQVSRFMRESVGGRIEIGQPIVQEEELETNSEGDSDDSSELFLTEDIINQIMTIPGIASYNAHSQGMVSSSGLSFRQGILSSESDNMGRIRGVSDSELLIDFNDDRLSLVEGRHIKPEDKDVVMISQTLAESNHLTIGVTVELQPAESGIDETGRFENTMDDSGPSIQAEIIGIYIEEEVQLDAHMLPAAGIIANQLFADHGLMMRLGLANLGQYEEVVFYVTDPSELPKIVDEIRQIEVLDWEALLMQHDDGDYMRISGDLQTIQNLIMILLIAIGIVSTIILTLILILRMRGRVHKVGILLSVGIRKKQIWGGFLLEVFIIAMLSFMVSYASSRLIVPELNEGLLADLIALSDLGEHLFQTMPLAIYVLVYLLILFVILLTAYVSTRMTIRLKPKQILSKMS